MPGIKRLITCSYECPVLQVRLKKWTLPIATNDLRPAFSWTTIKQPVMKTRSQPDEVDGNISWQVPRPHH
jgi:hypothetical protein